MERPREDIEAIFEEVRHAPPDRRMEVLAARCGNDADLREELESLLSFHDRASVAVDHPPSVAPAIATMQERLGMPEHIGGCEILDILGSGGMGVVYLAQQHEPVRRQVAIKVIKAGMDTEAVIRRFEAERQALAVMDHPGIATVFDAGVTEGGRPFFIMEYVRGVAITTYCDEHQLTLNERIDLFCQVCQAVQHAHAKGVIHRDLKPANILVGDDGDHPRCKIIDFGVAKATGEGSGHSLLMTQHGAIIGTPAYMSPEQATVESRDIDTRSDVYSLGVVLYELLTGSLPFDPQTLQEAGLAEIQRIIREEDPPRPSTRLTTSDPQHRTETRSLERRIRGDLDWIIMRCLEKQRSRRYDSVSEIARELERYKASEPVEAGPPTMRYRAGKFARRHGGAIAAVVAVAIVLIAGVIGTSIGLLRTGNALELAETARAREAAERTRAETQLSRLEQVNRFLNDDLLSAVAPSGNDGRGVDVTVLEVLDVASVRLDGRFAGDPVVEAALRETIGRTYLALGRFAEASPHLIAAESLNRDIEGDAGVSTLRLSMLLALLDRETGRYAEAEQRLRQVLTMIDSASGRPWFEAHHRLGRLLAQSTRYAEAVPVLEAALAAGRSLWGQDEPIVLATQCSLVTAMQRSGRVDEAKAQVTALVRWLEAQPPSDMDPVVRIRVLATIADDHFFREELEAGLRWYTEVVDLRREVLGDSHPQTIGSLAHLGSVYHQLGRLAEAAELLEEAVPALVAAHGNTNLYVLAMRNNLAEVYTDRGELKKARTLYEAVLEDGASVLPTDHEYMVAFRAGHRRCLERLGIGGDSHD
ncbi:MAG: tetratricopeptide repeat protein [Phycisphaerales bacterium]|jgi:tetratricopeptide (TPR) repeat protein|nr:tetratricopeptide repeat protein [Phycisphaerales bacterium]